MKNLGNTMDEILKAEVPSGVHEYLVNASDPFSDEEKLLPIEDVVGGGFYMVDSVFDLKHIFTTEVDKTTGGYLSLADTADSFDCCMWLDDNEHVIVLLCTNNAGGTTYFIPRIFVTDKVTKSIQLTTDMWANSDADHS